MTDVIEMIGPVTGEIIDQQRSPYANDHSYSALTRKLHLGSRLSGWSKITVTLALTYTFGYLNMWVASNTRGYGCPSCFMLSADSALATVTTAPLVKLMYCNSRMMFALL